MCHFLQKSQLRFLPELIFSWEVTGGKKQTNNNNKKNHTCAVPPQSSLGGKGMSPKTSPLPRISGLGCSTAVPAWVAGEGCSSCTAAPPSPFSAPLLPPPPPRREQRAQVPRAPALASRGMLQERHREAAKWSQVCSWQSQALAGTASAPSTALRTSLGWQERIRAGLAHGPAGCSSTGAQRAPTSATSVPNPMLGA